MGVEDTLRSIAFMLVRFSVFAANAVLFGMVPILLMVVRPALVGLGEDWQAARTALARRFERIAQAALVASATATFIGIVLQAVLVSSLGSGDVDVSAFESVFGSTFGQWYVLRLPMLAALAVLIVSNVRRWALDPGPRRQWWVTWSGLGILLLATSTFSGHAAVAQPVAASLANDVVHLTAGATWFSGIVMLAIALPDAWRGRDDIERLQVLAPTVTRFSIVALVSITIVAITGTLNSFLHVEALNDLIESGYGRALALKIGLFLVILVLGGTNHFLLRDRMRRALERAEPTGAQRWFRKTIAIELAVAIGLMAMTGVLTGLARTKETPLPPTRDVSSAQTP